jgi:hypothetical protein
LPRAAIGTFTRAALVSAEPGLAGVTVVRHRSLREVLALMSADDDATSKSGQGEHDNQATADSEHGRAT